MIYLDNSATTQIDDDVLDAMLPWLKEDYGNASSIYSLGRKARVAIEDARTEIASLINAHPAEVIFTSGGTESNNTILKSCVSESHLADSLLVCSTEHHSVLNPAEQLQEEGTKVQFIPVDENGFINLDFTKTQTNTLTHQHTSTLLSCMLVNNETGTIQPIPEIRAMAPQSLLHTDAVQAFGKVPVDVQQLGVDFATFSAHKIHGPKGIGAMFIRKGIDFKAHQQGGGQERNRRAGTEATSLIVGFQVAARNAVKQLQENAARMKMLTEVAINALKDAIPGVRINTPLNNRAPHIVNVSFTDADKMDGEAILQAMDMRGIAVSNGSACVSGSLQPSHVLLAMGRSKFESKAAVRLSVSKYTTEHEVLTAVTNLAEIARVLRD